MSLYGETDGRLGGGGSRNVAAGSEVLIHVESGDWIAPLVEGLQAHRPNVTKTAAANTVTVTSPR